ncbi:hypothetical protein E2C01_022081 [Portunus trituberculatus]|uniref:Uncharacterized protein n=1 Tax=Portunus trituberculatus TaxID=210409 RepID=A0A5B7E529_PORTR|nr:hypothetical protein [Portunus trituberculatus]
MVSSQVGGRACCISSRALKWMTGRKIQRDSFHLTSRRFLSKQKDQVSVGPANPGIVDLCDAEYFPASTDARLRVRMVT